MRSRLMDGSRKVSSSFPVEKRLAKLGSEVKRSGTFLFCSNRTCHFAAFAAQHRENAAPHKIRCQPASFGLTVLPGEARPAGYGRGEEAKWPGMTAKRSSRNTPTGASTTR